MRVLSTLLGQIKEYKKDTILTPIFTALEVFMEVLIPFIIASLIDKGIEAGNMQNVLLYGTKTTQPYRNLEETIARLW